MQAVTIFRSAVVLVLAMAPSAHADPFLGKPGTWEVTGSAKFEPNEHNEARRQKMTPEQRAEEDRQFAEASKTHTEKVCFTKKDMEQDELAIIDRKQDDCTRRTLEKSATRIVSEKVCPGPKGFTMTGSIEASSPESMKMQIVFVYPEKGTVRVEVQARRVGESCAGVPNQAR